MLPLYLRSAIDVRVWQESIPVDIRVAVDGRRLRRELEGRPFTTRDELEVVKLERLVQHVPMPAMQGVLDEVPFDERSLIVAWLAAGKGCASP